MPSQYYMLLNVLNIKKASDDEYLYIRNNAIKLAKDDYYARYKLTIGSFNMIITLFNQESGRNVKIKSKFINIISEKIIIKMK